MSQTDTRGIQSLKIEVWNLQENGDIWNLVDVGVMLK